MTVINLPIVSNMKECGTCTKCCEGWLYADIKGHEMFPGRPCFFVEVGKGCTIYKDRPEDPCKTFLCAWKQIDEMPDEFKPEISGVIMQWKILEGNGCWIVSKAPDNPTAQYLSWATTYAISRKENILWYIDDKSWWLGNEEFCKQMSKSHS